MKTNAFTEGKLNFMKVSKKDHNFAKFVTITISK